MESVHYICGDTGYPANTYNSDSNQEVRNTEESALTGSMTPAGGTANGADECGEVDGEGASGPMGNRGIQTSSRLPSRSGVCSAMTLLLERPLLSWLDAVSAFLLSLDSLIVVVLVRCLPRALSSSARSLRFLSTYTSERMQPRS